jgi:hypothetical protein
LSLPSFELSKMTVKHMRVKYRRRFRRREVIPMAANSAEAANGPTEPMNYFGEMFSHGNTRDMLCVHPISYKLWYCTIPRVCSQRSLYPFRDRTYPSNSSPLDRDEPAELLRHDVFCFKGLPDRSVEYNDTLQISIIDQPHRRRLQVVIPWYLQQRMISIICYV